MNVAAASQDAAYFREQLSFLEQLPDQDVPRFERRPWRVAAGVLTPFGMLLALALPALLHGLHP